MDQKLCTSLTSNTFIYCKDRVRELLKMDSGNDPEADQGADGTAAIINVNKVVVNVVTGGDGAEKDEGEGIPVELVVVGVLVGLLVLFLCCLARHCYKKSQGSQDMDGSTSSFPSPGFRSNSSTGAGSGSTSSFGTWSTSSTGAQTSSGSWTSSGSSSSNSETRGSRSSAEGRSSSERSGGPPTPTLTGQTSADRSENSSRPPSSSSGLGSWLSRSSGSSASSSSSGRSSTTTSSWSGSSGSSSSTWATGSSSSGSGRLSNLSSTLAHAVPSAAKDGYTPVFATKYPR